MGLCELLHRLDGLLQDRQGTGRGDPWRFLAEYPDWIQTSRLAAYRHAPAGPDRGPQFPVAGDGAKPGDGRTAGPVDAGLHGPGLSADSRRWTGGRSRAPIGPHCYLYSLLTLLACAGRWFRCICWPARHCLAAAAWAAAVLWPLAPAAILFQPGADTAYPLLSTLGPGDGRLGRAGVGRHWPVLHRRGAGLMSGLVLAFGMVFTLAFLPVGLIVALVIVFTPGLGLTRKCWLDRGRGSGVPVAHRRWAGSLTGANPVIVWTWNLKNHARFYVEYPRTYLAWLAINPIELAIAMGLPAAVWCVVGL